MRRPFFALLVTTLCAVTMVVPADARQDEDLLPVEVPDPDDLLPVEPLPPEDSTVSAIPNGRYVGSVGLSGSFWIDVETIRIAWDGDANGLLVFVAEDGELTGDWAMVGATDIYTYGLPFEFSGFNVWDAIGTITGSGPYVMSASGSGTGQFSFNVPELGPQTRSDSYSFNNTGELDGLVYVCGQVNGSWQQEFEQVLDGSPIKHRVVTYLAAIQAGDIDELDEELGQFTALVNEANNVQPDLADPGPSIASLTSILVRAERLISGWPEIFGDCDDEEQFMRLITARIQDVINTYMLNWVGSSPGIDLGDLRAVVTLGLRSGAIGAGSVDPARALALRIRAEDIVQAEFDAATRAGSVDTARARQAILIAKQLGMTFEDNDENNTAAERCLALGFTSC